MTQDIVRASDRIEPLLVPKEVCEILRIQPATLYAWVRRGKSQSRFPLKSGGSALRLLPDAS